MNGIKENAGGQSNEMIVKYKWKTKPVDCKRLTCMIFKMRVVFWKSYSRLKWICPTFSVGSELSMYMSTKDMERFCQKAICTRRPRAETRRRKRKNNMELQSTMSETHNKEITRLTRAQGGEQKNTTKTERRKNKSSSRRQTEIPKDIGSPHPKVVDNMIRFQTAGSISCQTCTKKENIFLHGINGCLATWLP